MYCKNILDREELWSKITSPIYANLYYLNIAKRSSIRKIVKANATLAKTLSEQREFP